MFKSKEIIKISPDLLKPHPKNPKLHNDAFLEKSIGELGNAETITIDENNTILSGHGRINAFKKLGLKEVEAVKITGWTEKEKEKYMLSSNQATLLAGFDDDLLKQFDDDILKFNEFDSLLTAKEYSNDGGDSGDFEDFNTEEADTLNKKEIIIFLFDTVEEKEDALRILKEKSSNIDGKKLLKILNEYSNTK